MKTEISVCGAANAARSETLSKSRTSDTAIFAQSAGAAKERRGLMDKLFVIYLVVLFFLVVIIGLMWEEIKQLHQDKRDWKNRYYAVAQIKVKSSE